MDTFLQRLARGDIMLFDGGMGSLLAMRGVSDEKGEVNLFYPQEIQDVHRLYVEAGADCIIANTFSLNGIYMAKCERLHQLDDGIKAAAENALRAADGRAYVFGDMGPGGDLLAPYGSGDINKYYEAFCHQAEMFAELALDGIILETVFQWAEMELMLKACRETAPQLPVICSMTFVRADHGGRTIMGDQAADIAAKAKALGAVAVGGNCGDLSVADWALVLQEMKSCGLPLIVQPNAGKPDLCDAEIFYHLDIDEYVRDMLSCVDAGAQLLGGCCGTTPDFIRALRNKLEQ